MISVNGFFSACWLIIITCKILVKIGPVVSAENRLTDGNCVAVHVVQHILSNISGYTGPIFAIFSPYGTLCADDDSVPHS